MAPGPRARPRWANDAGPRARRPRMKGFLGQGPRSVRRAKGSLGQGPKLRPKGPPNQGRTQEQGPQQRGQRFFRQEALRHLEGPGSGLEEGPPAPKGPRAKRAVPSMKFFLKLESMVLRTPPFYTRSARKAQEAPKRRQEPPKGFKSFKRPPKRRGTTRFVRAHNEKCDF